MEVTLENLIIETGFPLKANTGLCLTNKSSLNTTFLLTKSIGKII